MASPEKINEAKEARDASGVDYTDIPKPEVYATEITVGDPRMPTGAKNMIKWANQAGGWQIRATYSRGPWLHASGDRYTNICDLVRVRFYDPETPMRLSASWRRVEEKWTFEAAWDWSQTTENARLSSAELKALVRRDEPDEGETP